MLADGHSGRNEGYQDAIFPSEINIKTEVFLRSILFILFISRHSENFYNVKISKNPILNNFYNGFS